MNVDPTGIRLNLDPTKERMKGIAHHGHTPFDVPYISQIATNLWQGGCADGLVLPDLIEHVVSLYPWEAYTLTKMPKTFLEVQMFDSLDQATDQVKELAGWVNNRRKEGPVLVHCQAGLNRSSLIAGYALVLEGMSGKEAVKTLREKRSPACLCNPAFEQFLTKQESD